MSSKIVAVVTRHGPYNHGGDMMLTSDGRRVVKHMAEQLAKQVEEAGGRSFAIAASTKLRAIETANIMFEVLKAAGMDVVRVDDLSTLVFEMGKLKDEDVLAAKSAVDKAAQGRIPIIVTHLEMSSRLAKAYGADMWRGNSGDIFAAMDTGEGVVVYESGAWEWIGSRR